MANIEWLDSQSGPVPLIDGKKLASPRKAEQEASLWANKLEIVRDRIVLMGLGSGHYAKALRAHAKVLEIIIYEPEPEITQRVSVDEKVFSNLGDLFLFLYSGKRKPFQILYNPRYYMVAKKRFDLDTAYLTGRLKEGLRLALETSFGNQQDFNQDVVIDRDIVKNLSKENGETYLGRLASLNAEILK